VRKSELVFKGLKERANNNPDDSKDAAQQIVDSYEKDGAEAAWKLYSKLREDDPDALSYGQRQSLAEMASEVGLDEFAKLINLQAVEDFPKEARQLQAAINPSPKKRIAKNGLTYLQFSLRNTTGNTIQAEVSGPSKHPFGYGLPIRPNSPRLEDWPVGTKLYRTKLGRKADLLLTVEESFAGKIIDIPIKHSDGEGKK